MKILMYLLFAGTLSVFAACGGACADDCAKACCLGWKATKGEAKCIVAEDGSIPCCSAKEEAACCCGNAECAGPEICPKHQEDGGGNDHDHDGHDHE